MNMSRTTLLVAATLLVAPAAGRVDAADARGWYFPPPGEALEQQQRRSPREVGLCDELIAALQGKASRWALWRHGYLAHVEGDWNKTQDVASLRKTWHAMTVGAAIQQGRIPTYCQPVRQWVENPGDERVTWWHLITQTSALDYPHAAHPDVGDPAPGEVWTYSDKNPRLLCNALARVYGKANFQDNYAEVAKAAYFDAIGMRGWSARPNQDGVRFHLDLEDMGRLGLLALARGRWQDKQLVPRWFVEELETKQTRGTRSVYNGPDDGNINALHARRGAFPQCPYGFMTWVNTDGDFYPGADRGWAWGAGAGGTYVLWNYRLGVVFAGVGVNTGPTDRGIPQMIERWSDEKNPLVRETVGQWERWERRVPGIRAEGDPYRDVTLDLKECRQPRHDIVRGVWDFFDSAAIPAGRLCPRQNLVDAGYCLAEPGKTYLVYLENGGHVNVSVAPGNYQVTWINAANTADQRGGGPTNGGRGLTAPDLSDWLLLLRLTR